MNEKTEERSQFWLVFFDKAAAMCTHTPHEHGQGPNHSKGVYIYIYAYHHHPPSRDLFFVSPDLEIIYLFLAAAATIIQKSPTRFLPN